MYFNIVIQLKINWRSVLFALKLLVGFKQPVNKLYGKFT